MGTFATTLVPYFKTSEGWECGNKPKDLPIQIGMSSSFHLSLLLVSFATKNIFNAYVYPHLVRVISVSFDFY